MKKTASLALTALAFTALTSCSGTAKEESKDEKGTVSIEMSTADGKVSVSASGGSSDVKQAGGSVQGSTSLPDGMANWDEVIDAYEKHINKMVSLAGKEMNGGGATEADENEVMASGNDYGKALSKASANGDLTPEQKKRYQRITARASKRVIHMVSDKAVEEMQNDQ